MGELADYHFTLVHKPGALNRADAFSRRPDHDNGASDNEDIVVLGPKLFAHATEILDLEQEVFAAQKEHEDEMKKLQEGFSLNELDEKWFYRGHPVVPEEEGIRRRLLLQYHDHPLAGVTIRGLLYAKEMTFRERMARLQSSRPHQRRGVGGLGEQRKWGEGE